MSPQFMSSFILTNQNSTTEMKIFSSLFCVFATLSSAQDASVLDSHGFSEGVFDNAVYEPADKRVRRQAEDEAEASGDPEEPLSKVNLS